jgi:hypothetical protein
MGKQAILSRRSPTLTGTTECYLTSVACPLSATLPDVETIIIDQSFLSSPGHSTLRKIVCAISFRILQLRANARLAGRTQIWCSLKSI